MPLQGPQAVAGVSAGRENQIMTVYPSIAEGGLGRGIGRLCQSIPVKINGISLSTLLFALPLSPLAALLYFVVKVAGRRYVLTNRAVRVVASLSERQFGEAPLEAIDRIEIEELPGQAFYHAADLVLYDSAGHRLLRLPAVNRPNIFRNTILEARDARVRTAAALTAIGAR